MIRRRSRSTPGETLIDAVTRIRADIAATQRELARARSAGRPIDELKADATKYVAHLAERGRPSLALLHGAPFEVQAASHGWQKRAPIIETLAWLFPDAMIQKLHEEIDKATLPRTVTPLNPSFGITLEPDLRLSSADRNELIKTYCVILDEAERQEEALIERGLDAGHLIERRQDASPAAILGVRVIQNAEAA